MIDGFDISLDGDPHVIQRLYDAITREFTEILRERVIDVPLNGLLQPSREVIIQPNVRGRITLRSPAWRTLDDCQRRT